MTGNNMSNKKIHYLKISFLVIKIFITAATVTLYIHYFHRQSWGYFTINAKDPLINIYAADDGTLSDKSILKNNMSYGMGISRKGLILYSQLIKIISTDKNLVWKKLNKDSLLSIVKTGEDIGLINYDDLSIGKGRFLLTKTERIPFQTVKTKKKFIPSEYYTLTDIR